MRAPSPRTRLRAVRSPSKAIEAALPLLEKQSHNFIRIGGCNSCHAQDLVSAAAAIARDKGIPAPLEIAQLPQSMMPPPERIMDLNVVGVASVAWELFDFGMNKKPKTPYTDAVVRHIKAMQTPAGNWSTNEGRRPPMASGDFQAAALAIYSIRQYGQDSDKASNDAAIAKAVKWLESAKSRHHAGSRVPPAGPRLGKCGGREHHHRGARACGDAACRWRLEPTAGHDFGLVCDRAGALCA